MNEQSQEEVLYLIKELETNPTASQRAVSKKLGISLGKTNYLLKELIVKGLIKGEPFFANPGKLKKVSYLLTPKGLEEKLRLTYYFLVIKEAEYKLLKEEWERSTSGKTKGG
jgi:MarR family transcriptional regulator, temperature-dependent positive regulator of motility